MSNLKYLYYSIKEGKLLVLYLEDGEFEIYYVRFPFGFESKTFSDPTGLVLFAKVITKQQRISTGSFTESNHHMFFILILVSEEKLCVYLLFMGTNCLLPMD